MKYLMTCFAVLALVLGGCSGDDKTPTDTGKAGTTVKDAGTKAGDAMKDAGKTAGDAMGDAMKDAGKAVDDAANKTMTFDCAKDGCDITKEGTATNPPS